MSTQHTPTPWMLIRLPYKESPDFLGAARIDENGIERRMSREEAERRINALEGINPDAIPDMLVALKLSLKLVDLLPMDTVVNNYLIVEEIKGAIARAGVTNG